MPSSLTLPPSPSANLRLPPTASLESTPSSTEALLSRSTPISRLSSRPSSDSSSASSTMPSFPSGSSQSTPRSRPITELDFVSSKPYRTGEKPGGIRAWFAESQALTDAFYAEPPLISPLRPNEHNDFLSDFSLAARQRGRATVRGTASLVKERFEVMYSFHPFVERFIHILTAGEREQVVYDVLEASLRQADEDNNSSLFERNLKLIPEFTPSNLCAHDGGGLGAFFQLIASNLDSLLDSLAPVPNRQFFRKIGLEGDELSLPHSRGNRAYQEELVLLRNSRILLLAIETLVQLGDPLFGRLAPGINCGNVAKDRLPENAPYGKTETQPGNFQQERCSKCTKSAAEANVSKLLYCGACWKVKRVEPYCSRECQVAAFPKHRAAGCGRKLSEVMDVPDYAASLPKAATPKER